MGKFDKDKTKDRLFKELFEKLSVLVLIFPMAPHGPHVELVLCSCYLTSNGTSRTAALPFARRVSTWST
jgi:hypothetical protein